MNEMYGIPVECCECAIPIADDGALRAALLVPCQHLLHVGCVDYIRKRRKLLQLIDGADSNGTGMATPFLQGSTDADSTTGNTLTTTTSSSGNSISSSEKSNTLNKEKNSRIVVCPACHSPIQKLISLFPSTGDVQRTTNDYCSGVALQYKDVHNKQRANLAHLRALYVQRKNVTQLKWTCAWLHERLSELQKEVDSLLRVLPSSLPLGKGSRVAQDELCVDDMTATELELYIKQSSSSVEQLEREVREQRRLVERRRKKLSSLKARYRAQKAPTSKRFTGDSIKEGMGYSDDEGKCDTLVVCRRPRSAPVIDVDEEEEKEKKTFPASQVMVVSSVEGSSAENSDSDSSDDVVFVEQTAPPIACTASRSDSRGAANAVAVVVHMRQIYPIRGDTSGGGGSTNNNSHADSIAADADDDDDMRCYSHLQRVTSRQAAMYPSNVVRLLPRREDRLWHSSLDDWL